MTACATSKGCRASFICSTLFSLADVAVGADELETAVAPAAEFHPVGIVEVARH